MLMKISEYRKLFSPASRPDPRTVRAWVDRGELYGERRGGILYVDPDRRPAPCSETALSSPLARRVVNS